MSRSSALPAGSDGLLRWEKQALERMLRPGSLAEVLDDLMRDLEAFAPGALCSVLLVDAAGRLRPGAGPSLPADYCAAIDGVVIGPAVGSCGTAAFDNRQVIVEDIATDPLWADFRPLALSYGLRACWSTPIHSETGTVIGTFAIYYRQPRRPAPLELELVDRARSVVAIAIMRKQSEAAVRDSRERLDRALEAADIGVWEWYPQTGRVNYSAVWARMLGYDVAALTPHLDFFASILHPDDRAQVFEQLDAHLAGRTPSYRCEFRLQTASGAWKWVLDRGRIVTSDGQGPVLMSGVVSDITSLKHAERNLRESQQMIEAILDSIPVRVFWKDRDLHIAGCNAAYARDAGFASPHDVVGLDDFSMTWRDQAARYRADDQAVIDSGVARLHIEEPQTTPDGNVITLLTSKVPLRNAAGAVSGVLGTYHDISERKRAEEEVRRLNAALEATVQARTAELRHSERQLRDIFDGTSELIQSVGLDGRILLTNRAWRETLGYDETTLAGRTIVDLVHPERRADYEALLARLVTDGGAAEFDTTMVARDGRLCHVEGSVSVRVENGQPTGTRAILRDVTARKAVDQALRESEERHRLMFHSSRDAILTLHPPSWRYTSCNPAAVELFGAVDNDDLCVATPWDLSPGEQPDGRSSRDRAAEVIERALAHGSHAFEWTHCRRDGVPFVASVLLSKVVQGASAYLLATVRDITEQTRDAEALRALNENLDQLVTERSGQLRESEERLRHLVESSPNAVLMTAADGRITFANRRVDAVFGYQPEELLGQPVAQLLPAMPGPVAPGAIDGDHIGRRKDGSTVAIELGLTPVEVSGSTFTMATIADITARRQAEQALRLSEARKAAIFESTLDALITIDHGGHVVEWNLAAERVFGYPAEEAIGREMAELIVPAALRDRHRAGMARHLATGDSRVLRRLITLTAMRADGTEFPSELYITPIQIDPPLFTGFIRDITERQRAEDAVRRLAAFPEVNPRPVMELTSAGEVTYSNRAAAQMAAGLGLASAAEMLPPHHAAITSECLASGQQRLTVETRFGRRVISWSFYPIADRGVVHAYAADVTERLTLEEQLRQSQKMEAIGQLAGGVAHDFNNILSVVMMQAEVSAAAAGLPEEALEGLQAIQVCAERGADLTRQLLLFSRRQVMQPRELDLNVVVTNLARMLQRIIGEDVSLELHLHPARLTTRADAGMLDQVLMNLAVNARDAMPRGGRLRVETWETHLDDGAERPYPDVAPGAYVVVSVGDNGGGIAPDVLPRIFEPFFTTKEAGKGTGLGLATVFGIVRQHRGWVTVSSEFNVGTTFRIFLPAVATPALPAAAGPKTVARGGSETILVVEDEPAVRLLVRAILERRGYTVIEAGSGREALTLWRERSPHIDLLLTDLVMPDGINGQELARRLRDHVPGLRVVFSSGYSSDIAGRELTLGCGETFLQKPFSADHLADVVRRALDPAPTV